MRHGMTTAVGVSGKGNDGCVWYGWRVKEKVVVGAKELKESWAEKKMSNTMKQTEARWGKGANKQKRRRKRKRCNRAQATRLRPQGYGWACRLGVACFVLCACAFCRVGTNTNKRRTSNPQKTLACVCVGQRLCCSRTKGACNNTREKG